MAIIQCNFFSATLTMNTTITVVIPTLGLDTGFKFLGDSKEGIKDLDNYYKSGVKFPTLYLFAGLGSDNTDWIRYTSVERYADERKLALVIPSGYNGTNTDMVHGNPHWTFVSEELPRIARALFPLSDKREDNFAAGMSLGAYSAFKLALKKPEMFGAAASVAGALNMTRLVNAPFTGKMFEDIFGDLSKIAGSENDLFYLLEQLKKSGAPIPKLFSGCGTEDPTYKAHNEFKEHTEKLGVELTCVEGPGKHDWYSADTFIKKAIEWLPLK